MTDWAYQVRVHVRKSLGGVAVYFIHMLNDLRLFVSTDVRELTRNAVCARVLAVRSADQTYVRTRWHVMYAHVCVLGGGSRELAGMWVGWGIQLNN